jgi:hypothetical protein
LEDITNLGLQCRSHPADEVFVTGTFDKWSKSEKLERIGSVFEKTVALPDASEKIYYKVRGISVSPGFFILLFSNVLPI